MKCECGSFCDEVWHDGDTYYICPNCGTEYYPIKK